MPWSIFTQGGGPGAAATWADELLTQASAEWGVNVNTPGNEQFVFDWEESEGGGGFDNPLNQGPVPGHPELTTTGSQYGGGAADYASVQAGQTGSLDYLDMPLYSGVKAALEANNPQAAETALWASPWAGSHYGYGARWNTDPFPGQTTDILTSASTGGSSGGSGSSGGGSGSGSTTGSPSSTDFVQLNTVGSVLQYIDGFLNPKVSAVPGILNILSLGTANATVSAIVTLVDRAIMVLLGAGMLYIGFRGLMGGQGGRGIILQTANTGLRAGELREHKASRLARAAAAAA